MKLTEDQIYCHYEISSMHELTASEAKSSQWTFHKENNNVCIIVDFLQSQLTNQVQLTSITTQEVLLKSVFGFLHATNLDMNIEYMSTLLD